VKQYAIDSKKVENILLKFGLGKLESVEENKIGTINPVFLINQKYVLRIDLSESGNENKLKKESILFNLLPKFSIPTPKFIGFDDSCQLIGRPFLLIDFIPGKNLKDGFESLDFDSKKQISFELGEIAKKIHSVTSTDLENQQLFGDIETWVKKEKQDFQTYWQVIKDNCYLTDNTNNEIQKLFDDYNLISDWQGIGRLAHGDFSPNNIRINNNHIAGIFDFEFATIADPLYDLQKLPINFQLGDDFDSSYFLKGCDIKKVSGEEMTRLKFYCLSQGLWEIWATHTQLFPYGDREIEEGRDLIENAIKLNTPQF